MTAMTGPPVRSLPARAVRPGIVTAVVCLALAAVVAAMSSLNVALPGIARATHATQTQLAWIIDAYSLVFASLLLPAGAAGDRFGRRRALIAGLAVFAAASAAAMTASSADELIGLRAVMGLGAALVMPATLSTITGTFASDQRTRAVSVWAAVAGGAAVLGILASGLVLQAWSWPSVFALNVILAAAAIAGTIGFVPESADPDTPRLDIGGAVLAVTGLVALVYSIIEAPGQGWLSARTLAGLAAGLAVLAGFAGWELRRRVPMLNPPGFRPPGPGRRQPVDLRAVLRPVRLHFHRLAVPAAHPGRLRAGLGGQHAAHGRGDAARLPAGPLAGGPGRGPGDLHRRAGADRRGPGHPGPAHSRQRLLAAGRRADPPGRRHGPGHDPGHQQHHLRPARLPAGCRLSTQRPVP